MLTSKGKSIIAKYLIGETDTYASYIALGCGPKPKNASVPFSSDDRQSFYSKTEMDLETIRVPVTSKGFIVENDSIEISAATYAVPQGSTVGVITYVTSGDHLFVIGQKITVYGSNPEMYDVDNSVIVATTSNSFSVLKTVATPSLYVGGATAYAKVSKIILTGELPTIERYEFSEVGIYPAIKNPDVNSTYDSRMLFSFSQAEAWQKHDGSSISAIAYQSGALDSQSTNNKIDSNNTFGKVFIASSNNSALLTSPRSLRHERPRYLNDSIFLRGDLSTGLVAVNNKLSTTNAPHIHIDSSLSALSQSTSKDIIKVAFSVLSRSADNVIVPDNTKIAIEFMSDESNTSSNYAKLDIEVVNTNSITNSIPTYIRQDMSTNRYVVFNATMDSLQYSSTFSWDAIKTIRISAHVVDNQASNPDQFYIGLDAIRFENMSSENPLYGLVGYSVLKNKNSLTISKDVNKSGFIEFRYSVDVG